MNYSYLITYDLRAPGRNYDRLYDAIKRLGPWAHPLESVWIIRSPLSEKTIRDALMERVDSNDILLVFEVKPTSWASLNMPKTVVSWLNTTA